MYYLITAQDNKYETNTKHAGFSGLREIAQKSSQEGLPSLRYLSWANFLTLNLPTTTIVAQPFLMFC
jgi:hypothetical protein